MPGSALLGLQLDRANITEVYQVTIPKFSPVAHRLLFMVLPHLYSIENAKQTHFNWQNSNEIQRCIHVS